MNSNLVNKVGEIGQDNLIAKLYPPAETFGVKIAAGAGELKRGTVLALKSDGTYIVCGNSYTEGEGDDEKTVTPLANCVLSDDVDASGATSMTAVAYRTGHFNRKALIVKANYTMTITDEEELRKGGILLSNMME